MFAISFDMSISDLEMQYGKPYSWLLPKVILNMGLIIFLSVVGVIAACVGIWGAVKLHG